MDSVTSISYFETEFAKKFGKGTVIETTVTDIILPSQIITVFYEGFCGRLSVLDMSWCLPNAVQFFKKIKKGDRIQRILCFGFKKLSANKILPNT